MSSPVQQIGRYELLELLGSGGMAEVFRARLSGPGQARKPVALKLIHPQLAHDGQFVLMFLDELRIALALSHRNIVQTFDGGEADGHYYLVMELVDGPSLASLFKELGAHVCLPVDLALFIASEICAALDHAHGYVSEDPQQPTGVMHRDVSPGNILLSQQGDVKLTDFGVAKATGRIVVTMTDLVKGKLTYMSPEQARGTVTPVSDLFALGAVLYEMLTRQPIRRQATLEEVRIGQLKVPALRKLRPELSPTLEEMVMQCLATDPSRRPASARVLLRLLSEESRRVPLDEARPLDPRLRLQAYLARGEEQEFQPDRQDRAQRLAQAMMSEAEEVPEDSVFQRGHAITLPDQRALSGAPTGSLPDPRALSGAPTGNLSDQRALSGAPTGSLSDPRALSGAPTGSLPLISGTEPTDPQSLFWDDTATHEQPLPAYQEQQDSEALPYTDIIATESPVERSGRVRGALIAGAVGLPLLLALLWLWQDSAPVEDRSSSPKPKMVSRWATSTSPEEGTRGRNRGLTAGKERDGPRAPIDAERRLSALEQVITPTAITAPARAPNSSITVTQEATPWSEVRPRRSDLRRRLLPPGTLNLNADPWAKVYVDGKYRGETPLQGLQLSPGRHKIYLYNPQRELSANVAVQIHSGKVLLQVVKLEPR